MIKKILFFFISISFNANASNAVQVAMEIFPPYSYLSEEKPKGVSVELIKEVLNHAGIENIIFKLYNVKDTIDVVNSKKSNIIVFASNQKNHINESDYFVSELLWRKYVFFKRKHSDSSVLLNYKPKTNISIVEGDFNINGLVELFKIKPNNFIVYVDSDFNNIKTLLNGKSDLLVGDHKVIKNIAKIKKIESEIEPITYEESNDLRVLYYSPIYIYYPKNKVSLSFVDKLEDILDSMKIDGGYFEIINNEEI